MATKICVVGAGVVGLSCAVRVKETLGSAADVTIVADKFGKDTTSHVAAGVLLLESPLEVSGYRGRRTTVDRDVALLSFNHYYEVASTACGPKAGIHKLQGYYTISTIKSSKAELFTDCFRNWRVATEEELLSKFPALTKGCTTGYFLETVLVSPKTYMPWLMKRFTDMGGKVRKATVNSFDELWSEYDVVFNCTGLRAGSLTGDTTLYPVRGQIIRAILPAAEKKFVYIHNGTDKPPYFFWTPDGTVLGGIKVENNDNLSVSQEDHEHIMKVVKSNFPHLNMTEDKIIEEAVGLRPCRPAIRLETESCSYGGTKKLLIHNYGHGIHGICLSWGTACVAVEMLTDSLHISKL